MDERVRELDGLRGLAVLLVIALHTFRRASEFTQHSFLIFITNLTGVGWVGVDIFFVLSGYLITTILLKTRDNKDYFKNFYVRRILRIFPLYYVVVTVILILIPKLDSDYVPLLPRLILILFLYQQNWINLVGGMNMTVYLSVTWSLAIEEQFYLVWPAVVYYTRRDLLLKVSIGIILFSLLSRVLGILLWKDTVQATIFFYYNTFTRLEELVAGGLLAQLLLSPIWKEKMQKMAVPLFWAGLTVFMILCFASFPHVPHPAYDAPIAIGGYTSATVFCVALITILTLSSDRTLIRRSFRNGFLTFWGKYSYAAYLIHLPLALTLQETLAHAHMRGWRAYVLYIVLVFAATAVASLVTWNLLEKHFLNLKRHFNYS